MEESICTVHCAMMHIKAPRVSVREDRRVHMSATCTTREQQEVGWGRRTGATEGREFPRRLGGGCKIIGHSCALTRPVPRAASASFIPRFILEDCRLRYSTRWRWVIAAEGNRVMVVWCAIPDVRWRAGCGVRGAGCGVQIAGCGFRV